MDRVMARSKRFSSDPTEFQGKRALVTGGTKGMGEAIVRRLAASGATVATTARSPLPEGQTVDLFVQADISTREGVDTVVREVLDRLGGAEIPQRGDSRGLQVAALVRRGRRRAVDVGAASWVARVQFKR